MYRLEKFRILAVLLTEYVASSAISAAGIFLTDISGLAGVSATISVLIVIGVNV